MTRSLGFLVTVLCFTVLSFLPLPTWAYGCSIFLAFLMPCLLIFGVSKGPAPRTNDLFTITPIMMMMLGAFLVAVRLGVMIGFPLWPLSDEGNSGFLAMVQAHHWKWDLLWYEDRVEPLFIWSLGFFFKWVPPSLLTFRLFSALVSILTVFFFYRTIRPFFPASYAFLGVFLFSFSFYEWTLSCTDMPVILLPFFECLAFSYAARLLKKSDPSGLPNELWWTCLWGGIGFYCFTSWAVVWLAMGILIALWAPTQVRKRWLLVYGILGVLFAAPLAIARLSSASGMHHIQSDFKGSSLLSNCLVYVKGFFWDGASSFPFGPWIGGLLNPILSGLVLLGIVALLRKGQDRRLSITFLVTIALFLLPGILAAGLEFHRMIQLWPLLVLLMVLGFQELLGPTPGARGLWLGSLLLLVSFGWDAFHYLERYCQPSYAPPSRQWRSIEYTRAAELIHSLAQRTGPVNVFAEFNLDYNDKTLDIADHPDDAVAQGLDPHASQWSAILGNIHYLPFLKIRFPSMEYSRLGADLPNSDLHKDLALFLIPTAELGPDTLERWVQAENYYYEVDLRAKNRTPQEPWVSLIADSSSICALSRTDPFLTSIYWEKMASFQVMDGDFRSAALSFERAFKEGYPSERLRYDWHYSENLAANGRH